MATIAEMFVDIGADASQFEKETKKMQAGMKGMDGELKTLAQGMGTNADQMGDDWKDMSKDLQDAFKDAKDNMKAFDVEIGADASVFKRETRKAQKELDSLQDTFKDAKNTMKPFDVHIGVDATEFKSTTQEMQSSMKDLKNDMREMAKDSGASATGMARDWQFMSSEMKAAFKASKESMLPFKQAQQEVKFEFFRMAQGMKDYQGSTNDFMSDLEKLGKKQKTITENMMRNNDMLKTGFIQGVATMLARSGQSEKIAANFDRMNNPLYKVNNGLLAITGSLEKMAKAGMPAVLALKLLGPTADMKALNDMTMLITTGLMRFTMIAILAAVASALVYSSLFKAAKGPDPSKVFAKQEEALTHYRDTVRARAEEINNAWGLFEEVKIKQFDGERLLVDLRRQVTALKEWRTNITLIGSKAGEEFANHLAKMGPSAAGEIAAIATMSQPELDKYVALWKMKMAESTEQAVSELTKLKDETTRKVQELQDTLKPLGLALEPMKAAWAGAFQPMVDAFSLVAVPVANFLTQLGEMITKFNEAHPTIALVLQGFLMLIPALVLILSPLAIGIGLLAGLQAAFAAVAPLIMPIVTGLGAMMGTVLIVAAAIVLLIAAIWALWTKTDWFKGAVIGAWEAIKAAAVKIWNAIYDKAIKPAIDAIVKFVMEMMTKVKVFWDQNGDMILQAGKNVWSVIEAVIKKVMSAIKGIMELVWPIIKILVISTWNAIKLGIEGAINVILGIIQFFAALFTGDWGALWEATMRILTGAVQMLLSFIQLSFIGGILKGIKIFAATFKTFFKGMWDEVATFFSGGISKVSGIVTKGFDDVVSFITGLGQTFFNAGKGLLEMMAKGITSGMSKVLGSIKELAGKARDFLPFSPAKTGPLSDLDKLDFGGPIADSINGAIPKVRGLMNNLLQMPSLGVDGDGTSMGGDTYRDLIVQIDPKDLDEMNSVYDFFDKLKQAKRARG